MEGSANIERNILPSTQNGTVQQFIGGNPSIILSSSLPAHPQTSRNLQETVIEDAKGFGAEIKRLEGIIQQKNVELSEMKNSTERITEEFSYFVQGVISHLAETDEQETTSRTSTQSKWDKLGDFIQNRVMLWIRTNDGSKGEAGVMNKVAKDLGTLLETFSPPPLATGSQSGNAGIVGSNMQHCEDFSKWGQGTFCVCGKQYFSREFLRKHIRLSCENGQVLSSIIPQVSLQNSVEGMEGPPTSTEYPGVEVEQDGSIIKHRRPQSNVLMAAVKMEWPNDKRIETQPTVFSINAQRHGLNLAKPDFTCLCKLHFKNREGLDVHVKYKNVELKRLRGAQDGQETSGASGNITERAKSVFAVKRIRKQPSCSPSTSTATHASGNEGKFTCSPCGFKFQDFSKLKAHLKAVHGIAKTGWVIGCKDCGIPFKTRREHTQHRMTIHGSAIGGRSKKTGVVAAAENIEQPPVPIPPESTPTANNSMEEEMEESDVGAQACASETGIPGDHQIEGDVQPGTSTAAAADPITIKTEVV